MPSPIIKSFVRFTLWHQLIFNRYKEIIGIQNPNTGLGLQDFIPARFNAARNALIDPDEVEHALGGGGGSATFASESIALVGSSGTLSGSPITNSLLLFDSQGLCLEPSVDYSIVGTAITTLTSPGGPLRARYSTGSTSLHFARESVSIVGSSGALAHVPTTNSLLLFDSQGLLLNEGTDYSLSGTGITTLTAIGAPLNAFYTY